MNFRNGLLYGLPTRTNFFKMIGLFLLLLTVITAIKASNDNINGFTYADLMAKDIIDNIAGYTEVTDIKEGLETYFEIKSDYGTLISIDDSLKSQILNRIFSMKVGAPCDDFF